MSVIFNFEEFFADEHFKMMELLKNYAGNFFTQNSQRIMKLKEKHQKSRKTS